MTLPALTEASLDRILSFRDRIADDLQPFVEACYDHQACIAFDWPTWKEREGQRFTTTGGLASASLDDCRRVLTVLLRQDRFIENSLAHHASSGFLGALLDRMAACRSATARSAGPPHTVTAATTPLPPPASPSAQSMRLFTYKQTHDSGFAPNPFHGVCTLATCKPRIRLHKQVGDWIAGFTSSRLTGDAVGSERLIYLMQVTEKLPLEDYFADARFRAKIPTVGEGDCRSRVGDNIYGKRDGIFFQVPNQSHHPHQLAKDTSGQFALISRHFAYFGSEPLVLPPEVRPNVPKVQAGHGVATRDPRLAQAFVDLVMARGTGIHARPTEWRHNDESWNRKESACG